LEHEQTAKDNRSSGNAASGRQQNKTKKIAAKALARTCPGECFILSSTLAYTASEPAKD